MKKNKKIEVIPVGEDGEVHLVFGGTFKQAQKALLKYEKEEYGLEEDESSASLLEETRIRRYQKDGEEYFTWNEKVNCKECGREHEGVVDGYVAQI